MTQLEALIRVLTLLTGLIAVVGFIGPPVAFYWLRKHVRTREDTVTPLHMEERLRTYTQDRDKMLEKLSYDIRQDVGNAVSRIEAGEVIRHSELKHQVEDVKKGIREAFRAAREANDEATRAVHRAELTDTRLTGMENTIDARLKHIEHLCEDRIQKRADQ
jgi:hypothetical protein